MKKPELIIFDCDGVLVDSEGISARVLVGELAKTGIAVTEQFVFDNFVGRSMADVGTALDMTVGSAAYDRFVAAYHTSLVTAFAHELEAMAGVRDVIAQLNLACCVATSSSRPRALNSLTKTGLDGLLAHNLFTSSQVENGKPAPDLFLFAARQMGVEPAACLVIEDSLPGVQAALAAKMDVWRFTGGSHFAKTRPDPKPLTPAIQTFDTWKTFFDLAPDLKA